jgi:hypothetical protein
VSDTRQILINPDAPTGLAWLRLGGYQEIDGQTEPLPLVDNPETSLAIGPILVGDSPQVVKPEQFAPPTALNLKLGQPPLMALRGFNLAQPVDDRLQLTLYWQSLAETSTDWSTFVHLRNQAGDIVAQQDGPTGGGLLPTSLWSVGELIADPITLTLPPHLAAGRYQLVVGLYRLDTGERLAALGSPDNSLILTEIELH